MKKHVIFETSQYRLKIALLFISKKRIADALRISPQVVYRWQLGYSFMTDQQLRELEQLISNEVYRLYKDDWDLDPKSFGARFRELVLESLEDAPSIEYRSTARSDVLGRNAELVSRLEELLSGKTRRSKTILETLVEEGYSAAAIQRTASSVGVKKTVSGFGRNQKSYWSLK